MKIPGRPISITLRVALRHYCGLKNQCHLSADIKYMKNLSKLSHLDLNSNVQPLSYSFRFWKMSSTVL